MPTTAKLFMNGKSQAVRLPLDFRFEGEEVFIRRDYNGDVILSSKQLSWDEFFTLADSIKVPDDFMTNRDNGIAQERDLF